MLHSKTKFSSAFGRRALATATLATLAPISSAAFGGTNSGQVTISTSGSTALKNWFTGGTFTDVEPNTQISIGGAQYPASLSEWNNASLYQLSPKNGIQNLGSVADTNPVVRLEYHESGSVEGVLELANDQIGPVTYITQNVNRDPSTISGAGTSALGGNAVWVNYNQFGGKGGLNWSATSGGTSAGGNLGNFYNQSGYSSSSPNVFSVNGSAQPQFNTAGVNLYGGQNAVQLALSDAIPAQVFAADTTTTTSATPWTLTPQTPGYGQGNTKLGAANLGTANARQVYQPTSYLNMPAAAINPRTGTAFGTGAWNTGELNNLTSTTIASTATLFVANPGTGLTQLNRTDAQWLETTSRLQNGASFNMTTRDVNSGTRDVAALETGIDPTWASGINDDGNGNANDGASNQVTIGSGLRFSNKTAGGGELRPTVQSARMAIGTLSINDANGTAGTAAVGNNNVNPIRALAYSDSTDGSAPYVEANYFTIAGINTATNANYSGTSYNVNDSSANPHGYQYTIFQNEQAVTLKAPDANYSSGSPNIQGDDSTGDVKALLNNTFNSVTAAYQSSTGNSITASPITGLVTNGYIPPQLMAVEKGQNGLSNTSAAAITANPSYNPSTFLSGSGATAFGTLVTKLTNADPSTVTTGKTGTVYGGNSLVAGGPTSFNQEIPINTTNYLFGNFNQTGYRDYDSVVVEAQKAQAALETTTNASGGTIAALGNNASNALGGQQGNLTTLSSLNISTGVSALDSNSALTKGDLIVLGDYNGDGKFDGRDLYSLAVGASLTSGGSYRPTESGNVFTTGTANQSAGSFATQVNKYVLNKNVALDYLQSHATASQKVEAAAVITGITSNTSTGVPAGATLTGTDSVSGNVQFTFDPTGTNAYNKSDVNQDGVVDFNDALAVDALSGLDYTSLANSLTATEPAPVTGATEPANLVLATQYDANSDGSAHTIVNAQDLAVVSSALTGTGTTNWYGYTANKSGSGLIAFNRSSSVVNVYAGASLNINAGTVQVLSAIDPFTEANASLGASNNPAGTYDTSKSVALLVNGGTLEYSGGNNPAATGVVQIQRLASLNIASGSVVIDTAANRANRTLLVTGSLSLSSGAKLDLGNSDLIAQGGSLHTIFTALASGYAGGHWNGPTGISSAAATADSSHLTAIGEIQSPGGTFDGVTTTASDVLLKYTYYGDTNLDGKIDGTDYSRIDSAYLSGGKTGWANGDFNYDGVVDGSDYTLIDNAYNSQGNVLAAATVDPTVQIAAEIAPQISPAAGTSAVPEPTLIGLVGLGAMGLLGRRRRQV
jgi:hypothetical protein